MSTVDLRLCGLKAIAYVDSRPVEELEGSAQESYTLGQKTMDEIRKWNTARWTPDIARNQPISYACHYINTIQNILICNFPRLYEKNLKKESWNLPVFAHSYLCLKHRLAQFPQAADDSCIKKIDAYGKEIDLLTQTQELSLLILSTQNLHKVYAQFLSSKNSYIEYPILSDQRIRIEASSNQLKACIDLIQTTLEEIRPPIDKENLKNISPKLADLIPIDLHRIVAQYM